MKRDKIILAILIFALVTWRISRYINQINTSSDPISLNVSLGPAKSKTILLRTENKHIFKLDVSIRGKIEGSGQLSIGSSDSIAFKVYDVIPGEVNIEYKGDWYDQKCYLTYKATTLSIVNLEIRSDFYGD